MKKIILSATLLFTGISALFSFEWPQDNITKDTYKSYFGQFRGDKVSTSMVFLEPSIIKSAESGNILVIMSEEKDDSDFFPSTLGTSVIISHEDNLLSVYGNLNLDELSSANIYDGNYINSGDLIGESGNSGWQDNVSALEFQIIDTKNSSAINPKVLMSRLDNEIPLTISGITLENKSGEIFDLNSKKNFPAGLYKIYQKRNPIATPYKTSVLINGIIIDQLSYDIIVEENGKNCVLGKKKYTSKDIYPDESRFLLGEAMFTSGRLTLTLIITDINEVTKQLNYNLLIY